MDKRIADLFSGLWLVFLFLINEINRFIVFFTGGSILTLFFGTLVTYAVFGFGMGFIRRDKAEFSRIFGSKLFWLTSIIVSRILNTISCYIFR